MTRARRRLGVAAGACALLVAATPALAAFPGRNGLIAFQSTRTGRSELHVMDANGRNVKRLLASKTADGRPAWAPNGRRIAFEHGRVEQREIYVVDIKRNGKASKARRLTRIPGVDAAPAWSPNGRRIAFRSDRDGDPEIFVMNADGSNVVQLTANVLVSDDDPEFSPDGSRIAFTSYRDGNPEIYVMNADGSAPVRMTADPTVDATPSWAPDGRRLVFESRRAGSSDIWRLNSDGSGLRRLTTGPAADRFPVFSPDGRFIAFERQVGRGRPAVYVMRANGKGVKRLTPRNSSNGTPDWQRLPRR